MSRPSGLRVAAAILRRELTRFFRQPARIVAAVGTPALLWLFVGSGVGESVSPAALGDVSYLVFLLPGMMTLVAVFASIFASISVIEERQDGWLQAVLASPAPRWSIALGKTAGGALLAFLQSALLLPVLLFFGDPPGAGQLLLVLAALAVTSLGMTALGLAFAWRSETSAAFHAVMNLIFLPMWLLSGAFFPVAGAAKWLGLVMTVNPLTWCTESIRGPITGDPSVLPLLLALAFAVITFGIATAVIAKPDGR